MTSRIRTQNQLAKKKTQDLSNNPDQGMFKSRPFVVQTQKANLVQQPDLKTSVIQAKHYGHHINQIDISVSKQEALQPKMEIRKPVQLAPKRKRNTSAKNPPSAKKPKQGSPVDQEAKEKLGIVPGSFRQVDKPANYPGTYAGQFNTHKKTSSGNSVEVDHMTPDSLHQPLGQKRKTPAGRELSHSLPAATLPYEAHRRKLTTGSGKDVEHHRRYLLNAHHGRVPFARRMKNNKDHYAAATEIDIRNTFSDKVVFGRQSIHDDRKFPKTHKEGMIIPYKDMAWSAERMKEMTAATAYQNRISPVGQKHLNSVIGEQLTSIKGEYPSL